MIKGLFKFLLGVIYFLGSIFLVCVAGLLSLLIAIVCRLIEIILAGG